MVLAPAETARSQKDWYNIMLLNEIIDKAVYELYNLSEDEIKAGKGDEWTTALNS